jgi:hypothetical protein
VPAGTTSFFYIPAAFAAPVTSFANFGKDVPRLEIGLSSAGQITNISRTRVGRRLALRSRSKHNAFGDLQPSNQVGGPQFTRALPLPTLRNWITKRKASLTALSLRKAFRTSGSKRTRFVPAW